MNDNAIVSLMRNAGFDGFDLSLASKIKYPNQYGIELTDEARAVLGEVRKTYKGSQAQRILDYIGEMGSISSMEAFEHLGITSLPKRMSEIGQVFEVIKTWHVSANGKRFIRYSIGKGLMG